MKIVGLTGGIAMGKSTAATMLAIQGIPVHDADATVHTLYAPGGRAVRPVEQMFPGVTHMGGIDRTRLSAAVMDNPAALAKLEALMHPLVRAESHAWLRHQQRHRRALVVLDIPLLFETGRNREVDEIWVVNCPAWLQRRRALNRPGMTETKLAAILKRQAPQSLRLASANAVFQTGAGKARLFQSLKAVSHTGH